MSNWDQKFILMQRSWLLVRSMIKGIKFPLRRGHRVYLKWNTSYKCSCFCNEHLQLQLNSEGYMHGEVYTFATISTLIQYCNDVCLAHQTDEH